MSEKTLLDQIERLRGVLTRAAHGISTPEDEPLLNPGNHDKDVDAKLMILTVASVHNLISTLQNRHEQILLAMHFSQYTTFYARQVTQDLAFWTLEINDDIEEQTFLFQNAQADLEEFIARARKHPQVLPVAQRHKQLMDEFDKRNLRRAQGLTLYEKEEKPGDIPDDKARILFLTTRDRQMKTSLQEINLLISRALFSAKRLHVLETADLPDLKTAGIDNETERSNEISTILKYGLHNLENAETMLRYHAARHSAFSDRLNNAKPQP